MHKTKFLKKGVNNNEITAAIDHIINVPIRYSMSSCIEEKRIADNNARVQA